VLGRGSGAAVVVVLIAGLESQSVRGVDVGGLRGLLLVEERQHRRRT
jgi:hypothetical protein